jgi:hypothetical protein
MPAEQAHIGIGSNHPQLAQPRGWFELTRDVDLRLVGREEFGSGAVALRYEARR